MNWKIYAMDTYFFHSQGAYDFDVRCEMLRELGYDATYLTLWSEAAWKDVAKLPNVKSKYGLDVAAVYATLDIAGDDNHEGNRRIERLVETLEGCPLIELSVMSSDNTVTHSDPKGDENAVRWLEKLLVLAEVRNISIALYPHISLWLERVEDAVRLCRRLNSPNLGIVFTSIHWYALDGKRLDERLQEAAPYLKAVNLCGTRKKEYESWLPATIETLDQGELDNFYLLGILERIGYRSMIGFQGYSIGGDVYSNLQRSLNAYRGMEERLRKNPHWAVMN